MPKLKQFDENEVLDKAVALFWKRGYFATSIQELVDHLGISRSSIYDTFGGKTQLFEKSLARYRKTNTEALKSFLESPIEIKAKLREMFALAIEESVNDLEQKGCFVVNTTTEMIPGKPEIRCSLAENKSSFEGLFYDSLLRGELNGDIPPGKNLKAISCLIYTFYSGLKVVGKIEPKKENLLVSAELILALLD